MYKASLYPQDYGQLTLSVYTGLNWIMKVKRIEKLNNRIDRKNASLQKSWVQQILLLLHCLMEAAWYATRGINDRTSFYWRQIFWISKYDEAYYFFINGGLQNMLYSIRSILKVHIYA